MSFQYVKGRVGATEILPNSYRVRNTQYSKRKPAPDLKAARKEERIKFAEEKIFLKSEWDEIIFSDETKFNFDGPGGCQYYWHNLRKDPEIFKKRVGREELVMVWGRNQHGKKNRPGNSDRMSELEKIFQNIEKLFIAVSE